MRAAMNPNASTPPPEHSRFFDPNTPDAVPPPGASNAPLVLQMRHPTTGQRQDVSVGFSLPVALLGPIELARRRDWPSLAISLVLPVLGQLLLASSANRTYLKLLLQRGFRAVSTTPGHVSRIEWQLGMQLPRYSPRSSRSAD